MQYPLFILSVTLACAATITSCGSNKSPSSQEERTRSATSSDTGAQPSDASHTARSEDNRPIVATFGDSLTAGVAGRSYPENLQDILDQHGLAFRVDNQGVSGDTTSDGLGRIDNVISEHPALVILEFGGNDGLRGIPIESSEKNLREMIERLRAAKIPVALLGITLPPNYGPEYVKPFTAMFPSLARQYHLPYIPFLLAHVYQDRALMQPDGIHPSGDGNKIVAQDVFALIEPLLKRQPPARKASPAA